MGRQRLQSAIEYLATYIWLFLIIAVVILTFYLLGFFNLSFLFPRGTPGACYVYRPGGPFTVRGISLVGTCGVLPKYVGAYEQNIKSNFSLIIPTNNTSQITISYWDNPNNVGLWNQNLGEVNGTGSSGSWWAINYMTPPPNAPWIHDLIIINLKTKTINFYINDTLLASDSWNVNKFPSNVFLDIGGAISVGGYNYYTLDGQISNVQIYNGSLNPSQLLSLYRNGLGGPPIQLNQLVAWFPLNGDFKDYSGNNLVPKAKNIDFVNSYNYVAQTTP